MRLKPRYLMNAVDTSTGGGSPPPGGASPASSQPPTSPPAQGGGQPSGAAGAPQIDYTALAQAIAPVLVPVVSQGVHDRVFKQLREAGVVGRKEGAAPAAGAGSEPAAGAPPTAPAAVDVEAIIERRENFAFELGRFDAPASAIARARTAFKAENPSDISGWARAYASDMGWKERAASSAATANPNPTGQPPSPPPGGTASPPAQLTQPGPGAASSTAPGAGDPLDSGEIIDVSKLTDAQRQKLGPEGIRKLLDRSSEVGEARSGRPPTPAVLRRK
jgi:hypothetical protein